jgi:hypothetical protein
VVLGYWFGNGSSPFRLRGFVLRGAVGISRISPVTVKTLAAAPKDASPLLFNTTSPDFKEHRVSDTVKVKGYDKPNGAIIEYCVVLTWKSSRSTPNRD